MELSYGHVRRTEILGTLGPLELKVLETLCARGEASSREVMGALETEYAYTSISTTLDRLFRKGIVKRRKEDRTFLYAANLTPEDLFRQRWIEILQSLFATPSRDLIIANLLDFIADCDAALLDELERKIQEKRNTGST